MTLTEKQVKDQAAKILSVLMQIGEPSDASCILNTVYLMFIQSSFESSRIEDALSVIDDSASMIKDALKMGWD